MKKIVIMLLMVTGLIACDNFDIDHPDFDHTAGFFPYQYPVRTLVLGDYIYDNENDNAHKFVISVAMGGVYENEKDRNFQIAVDNSLCDDILFDTDGDPILPMPDDYYSLSSADNITIPAGKLNGGVEVQLTEAFFEDPMAIKLGYVVPIRLLGSADVDSVLVGSTTNSNADVRVASQWTVAPKNFTMFAVKYINEFHGTYFHYGASKVKDAAGVEVESKTYSEKYVENNGTAKMVTTARKQVALSLNLNSEIMTGSIDMLLAFDGDNCTVSAAEGSDYTISGTGEFKSNAYSWGNKDRNGIVLNYTVSDGENTYEASDVFVIRDRGVVMEVYSPEVQ